MKRILSLIVCLALVLGCFAGCGGESSQSSSQSSTGGSSSTEDSSQAADELSGTITINTQAGVGAAESWQAVADAYMELHPNVEVVVDLKASESYAEWIKSMFSSENPTADIVNINMAGPDADGKSINFMEYAYNESPYSDGIWIDQFNFDMQNGVSLATNEWNNLSLESTQVLWCYNQDIFDEVGVTAPTTWDEFVTVCEKLDAAGYQPISMAGDFNSF